MAIKNALLRRRACVSLARGKNSSHPRKAKLAIMGHSVLRDLVFFGASGGKKAPKGAGCCSSSTKKAQLSREGRHILHRLSR
eukprot:6342803-Amphidinium_carterae.1